MCKVKISDVRRWWGPVRIQIGIDVEATLVAALQVHDLGVRKSAIWDDEFYITRSLSFMLQKEGYECQVAYDGQAALEQVRRDPPALIYLDVDMPVKDGVTVAREIRSDPKLQDITIIMLTAKGQEVDKERGIKAGANDYIMKPFAPAAVLRKVKEFWVREIEVSVVPMGRGSESRPEPPRLARKLSLKLVA